MTDSTPLVTVAVEDYNDSRGDGVTRLWMEHLLGLAEPHEATVLATNTPTRAVDIKPKGGVLLASDAFTSSNSKVKHNTLWRVGNALVRVEDAYAGLRVRVAVDASPDFAESVLASVRECIKFPPAKRTDEVKMKFWRLTVNGGASFTRNIEAPTWRNIERNYPQGTASQLGQLMRLKPSDIGTGKIILLHGPAGCGKTTAIRALAREWHKWCDFGYAIDPENAFGSGEYLITLLTDDTDGESSGFSLEPSDFSLEDEGEDEGTPQRHNKWRLLIIEDAEEFLVPDAKHEVGQAVSRLLNVGDGILGQGLNLMVMLTTNIPVGKLSPAITRPGRCLGNIEVPKMSRSEASAWLGRDYPGKEATLAELWEARNPSQIGTGIATKETPGQYV